METTAGPFPKWKNCRRVTSAAVAAEDPEASGAAAVPEDRADQAAEAAVAAADGLFPDLLPIKTINFKGQINE